MANRAFLTIDDQEFSSKWFIEIELLMPFRPSDFDNDKFQTTVKKAKENLASYGITQEKLEEQIAKIIHVKFESLEKFRSTGEDDLLDPDDDTSESIEMRLEFFEEDHPELLQISKILEELEKCEDNAVITLDISEIHEMYTEDEWYKTSEEIFQQAEEDYRESLIPINLLDDFKEIDVFINHSDSK